MKENAAGSRLAQYREPVIWATVVTFNRRELLIRCVEALRGQTRKPDQILVVDNGSTDGTLAWLEKQSDITVILQENLGSAGGQHIAIKTAYDNGADRIWTMDDDGFPSERCLTELLTIAEERKADYVAPWVVDMEGRPHGYSIEKVFRNSGMDAIDHYGSPFNGILLSRRLVEIVGTPNANYFIWGDEFEYVDRLCSFGFHTFLALKARFIHPLTRDNLLRGRPKNLFFRGRNAVWLVKDNRRYDMTKLRATIRCGTVGKEVLLLAVRFRIGRLIWLCVGILNGIVTNSDDKS